MAFFFKGKYRKGFGEGAFFISKPGYKSQFEKLLGFAPYAGTFNVEINDEVFRKVLEMASSTRIKGFVEDGKELGDVLALPARIGKLKCLLIIPTITKHRSIVELISGVELREELGLGPGDSVEIEV